MSYSQKVVDKQIKELSSNPDALGEYLMKLVKDYPQAINHAKSYIELLDSDDWYLQKVSVYAVLYVFKMFDESYLKKALYILDDKFSYFDTRLWIVMGLSSLFEATHDTYIISILNSIVHDDGDVLLLRNKCIFCILIIQGVERNSLHEHFINLKEDDDYDGFSQNLYRYRQYLS